MEKKRIYFFSILLLMVVVLACSIGPVTIDLGGGGDDNGGSSSAGSIETGINAPAAGATLQMSPSEIAYHATSTDGIAMIELSVNGEVKSSIVSPDPSQQVVALKYTWQPVVSGSHTIRVRAQSSKGAWSEYSTVTVNVEGAQQAQPAPAAAEPEAPKPTETPSATATPEEMTIYNVKHDLDTFYYASGGCGSREITITADVTHPDDAYAAILFIRFWDKEGEGLTSWDSGRAMSKKSDGHFSVTLFSESIPNYAAFDFAVMYYQIKIQSEPPNPSILAGTEVIKQIELQRCSQ